MGSVRWWGTFLRYVRRTPLGHNHDFVRWKKVSSTNFTPVSFSDLADNWHDGAVVRHPRSALVESLLEVQGYLCAWTGHLVDIDTTHIDHVMPQSVDPSLDLTEENLVAAYPKHGVKWAYGAHYRGNWWDENMVRPNVADCERRLRYTKTGKVEVRNAADTGASDTIDKLNLNQAALIAARAAAIRGFKRRTTFTADLQNLAARMKTTNPGRLDRFAPSIVSALI
jgi:uncharacterized protein (TIGR02646 family)